MNAKQLAQIISQGESTTVEFKKCLAQPAQDTFETICSFANRYGGNLFLGVANDGSLHPIEPERALEIERNIVNICRNPDLFDFAPVTEFREVDVDGGVIIQVWVPVSPDVIRYKKYVYDRVADADVKIKGAAQIASMCIRKQNYYSERHVFPYLTYEDLRPDLIEQARSMAVNRNANHPWRDMSNEELLRSARLFDINLETGKEGYTLAAALLFGSDEVISSACPPYTTDCIVRLEDSARYDNRFQTRTNLMDARRILIDFVNAQLPNRFYLENGLTTDPRDILVRELVTNSLMHREYSSPYVARIIIKPDGVYTENASRSMFEGRLTLQTFNPVTKNPLIAGVFQQIGFAEQLGSGLYNLYKYSNVYSGKDPEFEDGDIFKSFVPVAFVNAPSSAGAIAMAAKSAKAAEMEQAISTAIAQDGYATTRTVASIAGVSVRSAGRALQKAVQTGALTFEGSTKARRYYPTK